MAGLYGDMAMRYAKPGAEAIAEVTEPLDVTCTPMLTIHRSQWG